METNTATATPTSAEQDVLVVVSKIKNYIRAKSEMNTAGSVAAAVSDCVRTVTSQAIEMAKKDGRKTVMERDFALTTTPAADADVLVVVSKLKTYVRSQGDMNTAGGVAPVVSEIIRAVCDLAVTHAKSDGRKTVMDRDIGLPTAAAVTTVAH